MTDPKDMELLAAVEHESWSGWTKWMLGQLEEQLAKYDRDSHCSAYENGTGEFYGYEFPCWLVPDHDGEHEFVHPKVAALRSLDCAQRWLLQMVTPYADLSEKEKESDRKVVREKLPVYRPEVADGE